VKRVSKKQSKSNRSVSKAKAEFLEDFLDEWGYLFCRGCGTSSGRIDISHLVPIGYNKSLESESTNLTLHCRTCHRIYENQLEGVEKMFDYKENLSRVQELDEGYYNLIKNKHGFTMGEI
jgi:5-methylcytosine-specific restriction endonuclease McrA